MSRQPFSSRLTQIFPPGIDSRTSSSSSSGRAHYTLAPELLYKSLLDHYNPNRIESIIVKSACYGKQKKGAKHEFMLVEVEDEVDGLCNFLVLDRNTFDETDASSNLMAQLRASSSGAISSDAFRVSYDGNEKRLLQECRLSPCKFLEKLEFSSEKPLRLYELVTLANVVSERYPEYQTFDANCYLFAGLIWDCLRQMRPSAGYLAPLSSHRGKIGWVRYVPKLTEKEEIYARFELKIAETISQLEEKRKLWKIVQECSRGTQPYPEAT